MICVVKGVELEASVEPAGRLLKLGEVVGFPTETVYGLGGNALSDSGILFGKILLISCRSCFQDFCSERKAKWQSFDRPCCWILPVRRPRIRSDFSFLVFIAICLLFALKVPSVARELASKFWPGPLTMVVPFKGISRDLSVCRYVKRSFKSFSVSPIPSHCILFVLL